MSLTFVNWDLQTSPIHLQIRQDLVNSLIIMIKINLLHETFIKKSDINNHPFRNTSSKVTYYIIILFSVYHSFVTSFLPLHTLLLQPWCLCHFFFSLTFLISYFFFSKTKCTWLCWQHNKRNSMWEPLTVRQT